jgi:hypothetical protein
MTIITNTTSYRIRGPFTDSLNQPAAGETQRTITDAEYAAIDAIRHTSPPGIVRDDPTLGIVAESSAQTEALRPLITQARDLFNAEAPAVRAALLPLAGPIYVALEAGDNAAAKLAVQNAVNPNSVAVSADVFNALQTALLAIFA